MVSLTDLILLFKQNDLLQKYHLKNVGIFGSILYTNEPNDIDILIEDYSDYSDLLKLREELEMRTGISVDIVLEKYASPIILHRAKKDIRYVA